MTTFFANKVDDNIVVLKLEAYVTSGAVKIVACKPNGEKMCGGNVLKITEEGTIQLFDCVTTDSGLKRADYGRLKFIDY